MKRARVAVAVMVTGLAAVLGISLLTPSGGATPALPARVSDNPVDYTPIISGNACLSDDTADGTCRRVRDIDQDRRPGLRRRDHRLGHRPDQRGGTGPSATR